MTEVEQAPQNGIDLSANEDDENSKARPADIEQDMREMERRKRVEAIMGSKLFREELERIVDSARDSGNTAGILQQLSDIVGVPASRVGSVYKASNCMLPINDIRGVESMGYAKGEKILRCKLAATFRLLDLYGWTQGLGAQITARLKVDQEYFLVNPYGLLYHEITASSLNKVDMQGHIVEQGTTNFGVNKSHFILHSVVHAARPDIRCAIYIGCSPVVAISSLKTGLLPLTKDACVLGEITTFSYTGCLLDEEERNKLVRNLGPNSKVMLLTNHGALCCGETIEEAFFAACHIVQACETQLKLLPVGLDNLVLIPEESRKTIYEQSRRPPEDLAKKFAAATTVSDSNKAAEEEEKKEGGDGSTKVLSQTPKWRVGGAEFEALMRMLDNAGYRTGYIYRHPLIKSDPPKPKNDVELPPAVSSLGYLLEEEELFRQGIWKKGVMGKGGDRSRWLNSPNVYQKVEVLETGTPDPKKITKWVAEGSPTHSTPVRIDDPLQFVPVNTNPKEFKRVQQQIKDNRRADKISAGPQSHILEGVTWDEANRIKDATVSQAGDHVVLMGAASKGIIQRGFQHNATVYKAPYAKNPFDNVTDDELNEYKRTVERKKKSIHGEYTDTDFSESEALSSLQTSGAQQQTKQTTTTTTTAAAVSLSEPEYNTEHQVMRIETQQAPVPSQPEVVLSDATLSFINGERSHTATNRKPPTGRDLAYLPNKPITQDQATQISTSCQSIALTQCQDDENVGVTIIQEYPKENPNTIDHETNYSLTPTTSVHLGNRIDSKIDLINEMKSDVFFQKQKRKVHQHSMTPPPPKTRPFPTNTHTFLPHSTKAANQAADNDDNKSDVSFHTALSFRKSLNSKFGQNSCKSPKSQPEACSLYYDISCSTPCQEDSLSYYTIAGINNSPKVVRECFTASEADFFNFPNYSKSLKTCSTPQLCAEILESLQKKPTHHQNYVDARSSLDLIWNIPIRRNYSPSITPDVMNTTPRKFKTGQTEENCNRKSRSPYRTLSHFGFNSPQRNPQPDHKHVVPVHCKKYIPLRRSVSYEEIFASPRYMDLCEHCFELIVRLKPEQLTHRVKLHNLGEEYQKQSPHTSPQTINADMAVRAILTEASANDAASNDEPFSVFSSHLEPLIEVEEKDSSPDGVFLTSIMNSTFLDKITSMNYSEISNNFQNTPRNDTLQQSLEDVQEEEEEVNSKMDSDEENLSEQLKNMKIFAKDQKEPDEIQKPLATFSEIWEFDTRSDEESSEQNKSHRESKGLPKGFAIDQNAEKPLISSQIQISDDHAVTTQSLSGLPRSLMNREERIRRKLEFQELWEDHVRYFENRQLVMASISHSDTESAIDDIQLAGEEQRQQTPTNEIKEQEIFPGQSYIYPNQLYYQPHIVKQNLSASKVFLDDESVSSRETFNVSETTGTTENMLHESYGSLNILEHYEDQETEIRPRKEEERMEVTPQPVLEEHVPLYRSLGSMNIPAELCLTQSMPYTNQRICQFIDDDNDNRLFDGIQSRDNLNDLHEYVDIKYNTMEGGDFAQHEKTEQLILTKEPIEVLECRILRNCEKIEFNYKKKMDKNENLKSSEDLCKIAGNPPENKEMLTREQNETGPKSSENKSFGILDDDKNHKHKCENFGKILRSVDIEQVNVQNIQDESKDTSTKITSTAQIPSVDEVVLKNRDGFENSLEGNLFSENKENEKQDEQLSPMERTILQKIEYHQLKKAEEIFNKIENTIRNKLTPSKLEMLVKEQVLDLYTDKEDSSICLYKLKNTTTAEEEVETPNTKNENLPKVLSDTFNRSRRSRSLTPLNRWVSPGTRRNKTTTPPGGPHIKRNCSPERTPSPCSSSSKSSSAKRRNFILENIRNAAIPRNTPQVKRLQGNCQAIFCKNPFSPRENISVNSLNTIRNSPIKINMGKPSHSSPNSSNNVYAFQSKLVRGSPRFWVSLSQSPLRKSPTRTPQAKLKKTEKSPVFRTKKRCASRPNNDSAGKPNITSNASIITVTSKETTDGVPSPTTTNVVSHVDAEINALSEEIQKIHPRLETYKRKLDDFGNRVAKCARHMDECVATQEDIVRDHVELKESFLLQQYANNITCRVQTFSLSETED